MPVGRFAKNIIGQKFAHLTVIRRLPNEHGMAKWACRCDCGTEETNAFTTNLIRGVKKSCGCLSRKTFDEHKICGCCKVKLPHSAFGARHDGKYKFYPYCKVCQSKKNLQRYYDDPEPAKFKARQGNSLIKLAMIDAYGGKCRCCGEREPQMLAIDHKNGGGTKHRRSLGKKRQRDVWEPVLQMVERSWISG